MAETRLPIEQTKHRVSIEYCVPCDYSAQVMQVTGELLANYQHVIDRLELVMGSKGVFEVKMDGELIFSKKALHRHPEPGETVQLFKERVDPDTSTYPR